MAIYTLRIPTAAAVNAGSHPIHKAESVLLVSGKFVVMNVRALFIIGAFGAEEMDVTQFHPLDAIDLGFVIVLAWRVDALSGTVARKHLLRAVRGLVRVLYRRRLRRSRSRSFAGPGRRGRLDRLGG